MFNHRHWDSTVIIMSTSASSFKTDHDMDLSDHHFRLDHPFHWFLSSSVPVSQFLVHHSHLQVYYLLHLLQVLVPQFLLLFLCLLPCFHLLHPQNHCPKSMDKVKHNCCTQVTQKLLCQHTSAKGVVYAMNNSWQTSLQSWCICQTKLYKSATCTSYFLSSEH